MSKKIKKTVAFGVVSLSFVIAAGVIETYPLLSVLLVGAMAAAVVVGKLDRA